jgi:hypothetical protein
VGINPLTGAVMANALVGSIVNTGKGFVNGLYANGMALADKNGYPAALINDRGIHYAPRLGIAYQFLPKTVFRAGFGMFYDRFQGNPVFDMLPNPPSTIRPTFYYGSLSTLASLQGTFFPPDVRGFDQGGEVPTTFQWNATIQRALNESTSLEIGYVANKANHLLGRTELNAIPLGAAWQRQNQDPRTANLSATSFDGRTALPVNLYRPYQGYGSISVTNFGTISNYNSMQISLNKNFGRGLTFGAAYTWSKALGTASGDGDTLHPFNFRMANYSLLDFDIRHMLVFNYVYDIPKLARGSNFLDNPVGRTVFNGWQISGLTSILAGQPANITVNIQGIGGELNRVYTGSENVAPRVALAGNPDGGPKAIDAWIDTSAFRAPQIGSQGLESAQRIVTRPGVNNWDFSIFKNVHFGAEQRFLQLRVEMFNAPNHTQFTDFNRTIQFNATTGAITNLPTSKGGGGGRYGFGAINGARDPRIIQLAAKFYF